MPEKYGRLAIDHPPPADPIVACEGTYAWLVWENRTTNHGIYDWCYANKPFGIPEPPKAYWQVLDGHWVLERLLATAGIPDPDPQPAEPPQPTVAGSINDRAMELMAADLSRLHPRMPESVRLVLQWYRGLAAAELTEPGTVANNGAGSS